MLQLGASIRRGARYVQKRECTAAGVEYAGLEECQRHPGQTLPARLHSFTATMGLKNHLACSSLQECAKILYEEID